MPKKHKIGDIKHESEFVMRLSDIAPDILLEMAYSRKRAEAIITGLEYQLNLHLLKLIAVPMPDQHEHWRHELATWLSTIASLRLKPAAKPAPASFYFRILFDEPFGGNEVPAVMARLQHLAEDYGQIDPEIDPERLTTRLHHFHHIFAADCATGTLNRPAINAMIVAFTSAGRE